MNKGAASMKNRISAWILTLVMIVGLVAVPAGEVQAEEKITVENATVVSTNSPYVILEAKSTISAGTWGANSPAVDLTEYSVTVYNASDSMISDWEITIQCQDAGSWNAGWNGATRAGNTITIGTYKGVGDDGQWSNAEIAAGETGSGAGFQIAASAIAGAEVTLTYKKGESSGTVSQDDTITDPAGIGEQSAKVTAEIKENQVSGEYHEYYLKVNNGLSESISDWIVAVPVEGITSSEQWGDWAKVKASFTSDYLYLTPSTPTVIAANNSFGSTSEDAYKFNYKGSQNIDTSKAVVYYKTGASATGAFDSVVKNATQATGGSGGTGGGGAGGIQGDTTTDLNLDVEYNFAKLLQYSLYFYDANMCGELEGKCGVDWRKNCHLADKTVTYQGKTIDVSGGFHDAGDHDKFGLPQGYSASILGIGYYEYKEAYEKTGQTSHFKTILDYFCDYFVRCTVLDDSGNAIAFCYQVGDGRDHSSWVAAEKENIDRPAYFADSSNPATDQVSEAAAALAIHYMNFGNETYLNYAKKLFAMAKKNSKSAKSSDGGEFYNSTSWADDYCLAAAWLYKATEDASYLTEYNANKGSVNTGSWPSWDDVGAYALAYGSGDFSPLAANATATLNGTKTISNGYAWLCQWGSARYNCNMQLEGLIYDKHSGKAQQYTEWANGQMRFLLGNSDNKRCYVVGYNENSSKYPHHRSSSGYPGFPDSGYQTTPQAHVLTGALVGGIEGSDGTYHDSSADYYCNEVAIDYNAAFTGAAAALYLLNENDEDQMLDSNYDIDEGAECPSNEGGIAENGGEETEKTKLTDSQISFPTAEAIEYGTALKDVKLSHTSDDYGKYAWKEPTMQPAVGTASYEMVYTPTKKGKYDYSGLTGYDATTGTVTRKVQVIVTKKILKEADIVFPVVSETVAAGTALKNITLSKTKDTYGTFSWKTPDTIVTKDMAHADVVYTLEDTTNVVIDKAVSGVDTTGTIVTRKVSLTVSPNAIQVSVPDTFSVMAGTELKDVLFTDCKAPEGVAGTFSWKEENTIITYKHNNNRFTVVFTPKDAATYETVETVVKFKVTKKDYNGVPETPTMAGKTDNSVTLSPYVGNGEKILYGMKLEENSPYTWQESNEFTKLSPYTPYIFALKFVGDDIYNDSVESETLNVTTYLSNEDCYTVDLSKLSGADYAEAHNGKITFDADSNTVTLTEKGPYTITGSNPDVTVNCGQAEEIILDNASFKRLEAAGDVVITLKGTNSITDGVKGEKKVTIRDGSDTSTAGNLTVTGSEEGAITAQDIVIESGKVDAKGTGEAPALKAEKDVTLEGGSLTANTESGTESPVQAGGKVVLDGCQVQSDAENVYSPAPVDKDGKPVTLITITYDYGNGQTTTVKTSNGSTIILPSLEEKPGYKAKGWRTEAAPEVILEQKATIEKVSTDITYYAVYEEIQGVLKVTTNQDSIEPLIAGYTSDEGVTVTIKNDTNVGIDKLTLSLSGNDFSLSSKSISSLAKGESKTVTVMLKNGLGVNEEGYKTTLTISCDEKEAETVTIDIVRKVKEAVTQAPYEVDITPNVLTKEGYIESHNDTITLDSSKNILYLETEGATYTITGENPELRIHVAKNVTVILVNAKFAGIVGDGDIQIELNGESVIQAVAADDCGIKTQGNVTISKAEGAQSGTLNVTGGSSASGIQANKLTIQEGVVANVTGQGDKPALDVKDKDIKGQMKETDGADYKAEEPEKPAEKKVENIVVSLNSTTLKVGSTVRAAITITPSDAANKNVTWNSNNPSVATVADGLIAAVAPGTAVITATAQDGSNKKGAVTVTVVSDANSEDPEPEDPEVKAQSMVLTAEVKGADDIPVKSTMKLAPKKKMIIDVSFLPEDAEDEDITYSSSNPKIVKVDDNGKITAGKKAGKAKITVRSENGLTETFTVQVMKKAVTKVKVRASKTTIKVKKTVKLKALLTPNKKQASNGIFWKSSNPKVATVSASGVVKGVKKGKVKITAVATDGSGKKAYIKLKIK